MSQTTELILKIKEVGGEQLTKLAGKLETLKDQSKLTNVNFKEFNAELKGIYSQSTQSINSLRAFAAAFRDVANNADITSQEFFDAKMQADLLDQRLAKLAQTNVRVAGSFKQVGVNAQQAAAAMRTSTGLIRDPLTGAYRGIPGVTQYDQPIGPAAAPVSRGIGAFLAARGLGGVGGAARIAGGIASGAVFGGAAGAGGAALGALGGPAGIIAGATIGAVGGQIQATAGATATYAANLDKQRTALAGLTRNYKEYQSALSQVEKLSQQFAIPQEIITRQFTKLAASVLGAGGNLQDTEKAFKGVAAGIRGTGGDLQDLESALTATAQVFSKGKVSAEELRQQIGERLPGAFTLFAQSLNMTPAELDKALEGGKVSLQDFQKFSELLFQRFGKSAEAIVKSPAAAGDRLQTALSKLNENVGKLLAPIGAAFQNVFAGIVIAINQAAAALVRFFNLNIADRVEEYQQTVTRLEGSIEKAAGQRRAGLRRQLATAKLNLKIAQEQRALRMAGAQKDREDTGLPGIVPDAAGGGSRSKRAKEIKDITAEELELRMRIGMAQTAEDKRQEAYYTKQQALLQIAREEIGPNERKAKIMDAVVKYATTLRKINLDELKTAQEFNKQFTYEGVTPEEFPSVFKTLNDQIKMLQQTMQDVAPRMTSLADGMAGALSGAFEGLVFSAQSANEALASVFQNIAKSFQNMVIQMINDYLKMQIMTFFKNLFAPSLPSFSGLGNFGPASSVFTSPSFGISTAGLGAGLSGAGALKSSGFYSGIQFALGGIMTSKGSLPLKRYAVGGVANSPQLAMFGEGSTPEAYVPLPDGRSIPVTMKGQAGSVNVVVNVDAKGSEVQGDQSQAKALGGAISAAVQAEIVKQQRPGGLLAGTR